jgi:hypothetical protein
MRDEERKQSEGREREHAYSNDSRAASAGMESEEAATSYSSESGFVHDEAAQMNNLEYSRGCP